MLSILEYMRLGPDIDISSDVVGVKDPVQDFLTLPPHTQLKKYNSLPGDEVCIVCAKYRQQLGSAKTTGDRLSREL